MSHYEDLWTVKDHADVGLRIRLEKETVEKEKWKKIAKSMAKVLMDLGEGQDQHDKANKLVKKHFPKIYQSYE